MRRTGNRLLMNGVGVLGAVALGLMLAFHGRAGADSPRAPNIVVVPGAGPALPVLPYPNAQVLNCWSDVRLFNTLRNGNFPYCRQKMRYRPGALECFQITEQVCEVIPAGGNLPIQTTSPVNRQVIPCPDGPEPPVCRRLDIQ
jgi:hypothetical protein